MSPLQATLRALTRTPARPMRTPMRTRSAVSPDDVTAAAALLAEERHTLT